MEIHDFCLRADDDAAMRAALVEAGFALPDEIAPWSVIERQEPQCALLWIGTMYGPVTVDPESGEPTGGGDALVGLHANLRWIGDGCPDLSAVMVEPEPATPQAAWAGD